MTINLSHGINNRHGKYNCKITSNHSYADAADEIGAWLDCLTRQGVKRMVLLGHSRGGSETALFAAEHDKAIVKAVVLLAPDTRETNDAAAYQRRYHKPLMPILEKAQKLVKAGKGGTVLTHTDFLFYPDTFVSYLWARSTTRYGISHSKNQNNHARGTHRRG